VSYEFRLKNLLIQFDTNQGNNVSILASKGIIIRFISCIISQRIEHSRRGTSPAPAYVKSIKSGYTPGLVYTKHTANKCNFDLIYDYYKEQTQ
jgi:hypothetical protein